MDFEWDRRKAESNPCKHSVDFADAATLFDDEYAVTMPDASSDEERFVALGADALGRLLVVMYTWREDRIRLISARQATRSERRIYEERP